MSEILTLETERFVKSFTSRFMLRNYAGDIGVYWNINVTGENPQWRRIGRVFKPVGAFFYNFDFTTIKEPTGMAIDFDAAVMLMIGRYVEHQLSLQIDTLHQAQMSDLIAEMPDSAIAGDSNAMQVSPISDALKATPLDKSLGTYAVMPFFDGEVRKFSVFDVKTNQNHSSYETQEEANEVALRLSGRK